MTTSRERMIRSLCHQPIDRAPRDLWVAPRVERDLADDVAEIRYRFPPDVEQPDSKPTHGDRSTGRPGELGVWTDAWGCAGKVDQPGSEGLAIGPPLADATRIATYQPPLDLLDPTRIPRVNRACAMTSRFVLAPTETHGLARVLLLLGREAARSELAHGTACMRGLIARLHDFSCREMEMWAASDVDGVALAEDLGWDVGPPRPAEVWREIFRPLVREYCAILRRADKFIFFHGGGNVAEILPDLVELGVDAVGCELARLNPERLAAEFRGKITFWGELGDEDLSGRSEGVRAAVTRVRAALDFGRGGVIAHCHWTPGVPLKNIATVFDQWMQPLAMRAKTAAG